MGGNARPHVFLFDVRNTLGVVVGPGRLAPFRPSTDDLLASLQGLEGARLAVLTNTPPGVDAQKMIADAGLAGRFEMVISTQHPEILAARTAKPQRSMYEIAARLLGVAPSDCTYVSENLLEVLGAINAGMAGVLKRFPPGGDYIRQPLKRAETGPTKSGRLSEAVLEGQHAVGGRIVAAARRIAEAARAVPAGSAPPPPLARLVWLMNHFVDPYHHRMEEDALFPFALLRGMPPERLDWVLDDHRQGRAYFAALTIALHRCQRGSAVALVEFAAVCEAFVELYDAHGKREDDEVFKEIGDLLTDADDAIVCGLIERMAPPDITLHFEVIDALESDLRPEAT
jgi:hemerythrin-like domain-containing protein